MDQFEELISNCEFELIGNIATKFISQFLAPDFDLSHDKLGIDGSKEHGWVYLWVKSYASGLREVCYVGKAGKTLKERFSQHINGARNGSSGSIKGRQNALSIKEFLDMNSQNRILIYARKSDNVIILDEEVSNYSVEEEALIKKCKRMYPALWNRL